MRFRIAIGAMATCALMLAAQSVPVVSAAPKRVYKGKTAQKRAIKLTVRGNKLDMKRFKARLRCKNGTALILDESGFVPTPLRKGDRFKDRQRGKTDTVFFKGRVRGRVVRGQLRVVDRLGKGKRSTRCASRWIGFRARLR